MSTSNKSGGCGHCQRKYPCQNQTYRNKQSKNQSGLTYSIGPLSWITGYGPHEPIADKPFVDTNAFVSQVQKLVDFLKLSCLGSLNDSELFKVYHEIIFVLSQKLGELQDDGSLTPPPAGECQYVTMSNFNIQVTTENCNFPSGRPKPPYTKVEAKFDIQISTQPCP